MPASDATRATPRLPVQAGDPDRLVLVVQPIVDLRRADIVGFEVLSRFRLELAEGIETGAELRILRQLGVPLAQGYFLARPGAPWPMLGPEALAISRGTPAYVRSPAVASRLLEVCATCSVDEPWPDARLAVRLTAGRPTALRVTEAGSSYERSEHQLLRIKRESSIADVAQRAVTRDPSSCWDPLVCVDDMGSFLGVIRMPILVSALAELVRANAARHS